LSFDVLLLFRCLPPVAPHQIGLSCPSWHNLCQRSCMNTPSGNDHVTLDLTIREPKASLNEMPCGSCLLQPCASAAMSAIMVRRIDSNLNINSSTDNRGNPFHKHQNSNSTDLKASPPAPRISKHVKRPKNEKLHTGAGGKLCGTSPKTLRNTRNSRQTPLSTRNPAKHARNVAESCNTGTDYADRPLYSTNTDHTIGCRERYPGHRFPKNHTFFGPLTARKPMNKSALGPSVTLTL
jgi:hypothetical protein